MNREDRPKFGEALRQVFAVYGKPLPNAEVLEHWWKTLLPFPPNVIADAFEGHIANSSYAPVPAEIRAQCVQARKQQADASAMRLTYSPRADDEIAHANLARLREIVAPLSKPRTPTAEWAFTLLLRGTSCSDLPLTPEVLRVAGDAVLSFEGQREIAHATGEQRAEYAALARAIAQKRGTK